MKIKFLPILTLLITVFGLTSCFNASEELWIESDGTGRYESTNDFSSFYPFMMMGLQQEAESEEGEAESEGFEQDMRRLLLAEKTDTVFDLSGIFASAAAEKGQTLDQMMAQMEAEMKADDTMPEDQKEALFGMIEGLMDMKLRMQANQSDQMFKTTNIQQFDNINSLTNFGETLGGILPMMGGGNVPAEAMGAMDQLFNSMTQFDLDGNTLRIRRAGIDLEALAGEEADAEAMQTIGMVKMFLGEAPYQLKIHLPGKVKKINSDYLTKIDKTTVALEIPMSELFDPELWVDATVTFKGLKK